MDKRQVYIVIDGRVQGVGFRYFAMEKAEELHITGWVKNTWKEKIEMEVSGEVQYLHTFIAWMKIGPARAVIHRFTVSDILQERTYTQFTIR